MPPPRRPYANLIKLALCFLATVFMLSMILKLSAIAGVIDPRDDDFVGLVDPVNVDVDGNRDATTQSPLPQQLPQAPVAQVHLLPVWHPADCFKGTFLNHAKIIKSCREGVASGTPVDPHYCSLIQNASGTKQPQICGQYASGTFVPSYRVLAPVQWQPNGHLAGEACRDPSMFRRHLTPAEAAELSFQRVGTPSLSSGAGGGGGSGVFEERLLATSSCVGGLRYFSPQQVVTILHRASIGRNGRGILFSGDSMMRQLMLRIVSFVRQEPFFSEHYFHQDGLYVLYEGGDQLTVLDNDGKADMLEVLQSHFPGYLADAAEVSKAQSSRQSRRTAAVHSGKILLAMMFQWETKPSAFRQEFTRMKLLPLHVASFMYWWQNKDPISDIDRYFSAVEHHLGSEDREWARLGAVKDYVFITTPWTDPGLFGGVEASTRLARNEKTSMWIAQQKERATADVPTRWSLLDYASLAEAEHHPKTKDGIHYMCIWTPKYPDTVKMQKFNYNQCRDPMGLGVVQWLMHTVAGGL